MKVLIAIWCLAAWKPRKWSIRGKNVVLQPGQLFISAQRLADFCNGNRKKGDVTREVVRKAIKHFERLEVLTTENGTSEGTLITVINWDKYQSLDNNGTNAEPAENQRRTTTEPAENQQGTSTEPTIKKESNHVRKIEGKKGKTKEGAADLLSSFAGKNQELREALLAWMDMRKSIRKPLTPYGLRLALRKLQNISRGDESLMLRIVNQSVERNWLTFFPLKDGGLRKSNFDDVVHAFEEEGNGQGTKGTFGDDGLF